MARSTLAVLLAAATVLAAAIRLWGLDAHGAWFDEAYYAFLTGWGGPAEVMAAVLATPPSAPLYALTLDLWTLVFGTSDLAIRLPSVVAGTLTVPAAAWLAHEATWRRHGRCRPRSAAAGLGRDHGVPGGAFRGSFARAGPDEPGGPTVRPGGDAR